MARSSRLSVCLEMERRNSSQSHWIRSIKRQRTTPWMAGIGPASTRATKAARCASVSRGGRPGARPVRRPSGPRALKRSTRSARSEDGNSHGDLQTGDRLRELYLCPPGNPPHEFSQTATWYKSGRAIIGALIAGERDPDALLRLVQRGVKAPPERLRAALTGRITERHRFLLRLHLRQIDALGAAIAEIDQEVDRALDPFRQAVRRAPKTTPQGLRIAHIKEPLTPA